MKRQLIYSILAAFLCLLASCHDEEEQREENTANAQIKAKSSGLKILAIGNSFTDDATRYLPSIIDALGEYDVFAAKIVKSASSLRQHWENLNSDAEVYEFAYCDRSSWHLTNVKTLNTAIDFTDWDYIVLQQISELSGFYDSYQPFLDNLISEIKGRNPSTKIVWHMTWAYASDSEHPYFKDYDFDRHKMYEAISSATEEVDRLVDLVIPSGTVIEELRESEYNTERELTRDGYHLDRGFPCFALSCLWHEYLITPYTHESCVAGNEDKIASLMKRL